MAFGNLDSKLQKRLPVQPKWKIIQAQKCSFSPSNTPPTLSSLEKSLYLVSTQYLVSVWVKVQNISRPHPLEIRAHLKENIGWTRWNCDIFPFHVGECHNFSLTDKTTDPFFGTQSFLDSIKRAQSTPPSATSVSNTNWTTCLSIHLHTLDTGVPVPVHCMMQSQTLEGLTELHFTNLSPLFMCPYKIFICKKALIWQPLWRQALLHSEYRSGILQLNICI